LYRAGPVREDAGVNLLSRFRPSVLVAVVLASCIGCDQATKRLATTELRDTGTQSFLGDTFRLGYAENPGAFLGMGGRLGGSAQFWIFTVGVGALLIAALGYLALRARHLGGLQAIAVALLVGGGLSNWFDRVVNEGRVVDFMNLGIGPVRTGIFNVADVAIVVGVALMVLLPRPPVRSTS
jgi:signal peptidase II